MKNIFGGFKNKLYGRHWNEREMSFLPGNVSIYPLHSIVHRNVLDLSDIVFHMNVYIPHVPNA